MEKKGVRHSIEPPHLLAAGEVEELQHGRNEGHRKETTDDSHVRNLLIRRLLGSVVGALNLG